MGGKKGFIFPLEEVPPGEIWQKFGFRKFFF
ncbi:hypothetical protein EBI_26272 [Enterocytozoon bieneusi H348]|nr:hypothetical protein EBI_26272 [Enterocytozoon bieneusi H348]|eukprot:XP_002650903.1 hypothetical protein EBI_26272 [Enterocytozoon bieneusi H348]